MNINLFHSNKIEGKALSFLLKEEGFKVILGQIDLMSTYNSALNSNSILVVDAIFLSQISKSKIKWLCNTEFQIALLGSLNQLFWFFKFDCKPRSFICKEEDVGNLYSGINKLTNKESYLSNKTIAFLKKETFHKHQYLLKQDLQQYLTATELKTMLEIAKGKTTQQIAKKWHRSHHTIYNHRKNIIKKLNLNGTFRLTKFCLQNRRSIQTLISVNKNEKFVKALIKK